RPKRILALQSRNRMDFRRAPQCLRTCLGKANRSDLACGNKFGHRANGFFDRNVRINAMLIIQIDRFDAHPANARVASTADTPWRAIHASDAVRIEAEAKLSRYQYVLARNLMQEMPEQFLYLVRAVDDDSV